MLDVVSSSSSALATRVFIASVAVALFSLTLALALFIFVHRRRRRCLLPQHQQKQQLIHTRDPSTADLRKSCRGPKPKTWILPFTKQDAAAANRRAKYSDEDTDTEDDDLDDLDEKFALPPSVVDTKTSTPTFHHEHRISRSFSETSTSSTSSTPVRLPRRPSLQPLQSLMRRASATLLPTLQRRSSSSSSQFTIPEIRITFPDESNPADEYDARPAADRKMRQPRPSVYDSPSYSCKVDANGRKKPRVVVVQISESGAAFVRDIDVDDDGNVIAKQPDPATPTKSSPA
ncbi:uncharacterized protein V1518DRAFT_422250 [Limtongia smithiae]|uniref:uncharacterized protein n=1 Tax=Limtongia smithiae TaxID=1125753 RepID=UPI0034CE86B4